jgi:hypothetical protein
LCDTNGTRSRHGVWRTLQARAKASSETGVYALVLVLSCLASVALKDARLPTRFKARRVRRDKLSCLKNHLDDTRGTGVFDILLDEVRRVFEEISGVNNVAAGIDTQLPSLVAGEQNDAVEDAKLALDGAAQVIALAHSYRVISHDLI